MFVLKVNSSLYIDSLHLSDIHDVQITDITLNITSAGQRSCFQAQVHQEQEKESFAK